MTTKPSMNFPGFSFKHGVLPAVEGAFLLLFLICFPIQKAHSSITADATISGVQAGPVYHYTITLNNTGSAGDDSIGTFWYGWVPGENFLPSSPSNIHSPTGWVAAVTHGGTGDGYAIQWQNSTGKALAPGSSFNQFSFDSTNPPASFSGNSVFYTFAPVGTSFLYSGSPFVGSSTSLVVGNALISSFVGSDKFLGTTPDTNAWFVNFDQSSSNDVLSQSNGLHFLVPAPQTNDFASWVWFSNAPTTSDWSVRWM